MGIREPKFHELLDGKPFTIRENEPAAQWVIDVLNTMTSEVQHISLGKLLQNVFDSGTNTLDIRFVGTAEVNEIFMRNYFDDLS